MSLFLFILSSAIQSGDPAGRRLPIRDQFTVARCGLEKVFMRAKYAARRRTGY
jgi:hypothetical protein